MGTTTLVIRKLSEYVEIDEEITAEQAVDRIAEEPCCPPRNQMAQILSNSAKFEFVEKRNIRILFEETPLHMRSDLIADKMIHNKNQSVYKRVS